MAADTLLDVSTTWKALGGHDPAQLVKSPPTGKFFDNSKSSVQTVAVESTRAATKYRSRPDSSRPRGIERNRYAVEVSQAAQTTHPTVCAKEPSAASRVTNEKRKPFAISRAPSLRPEFRFQM